MSENAWAEAGVSRVVDPPGRVGVAEFIEGRRIACKTCNEPVFWAESYFGKNILIDVAPHPPKSVVVEVVGGVLSATPADAGTHSVHFQRCKPKKREKASDLGLAAAPIYTICPRCDGRGCEWCQDSGKRRTQASKKWAAQRGPQQSEPNVPCPGPQHLGRLVNVSSITDNGWCKFCVDVTEAKSRGRGV
jgi:hypothetical protein